MKIRNLISVAVISGTSLLFSTGAFALSPGGAYSFSVVCNTAQGALPINGMAILGSDRTVSIVDDNNANIDTTAIGVWDKDGQVVSGKAVFFRTIAAGQPAIQIRLDIANGAFNNQTGVIDSGTLTITPPAQFGAPVLCNNLVLTPYS